MTGIEDLLEAPAYGVPPADSDLAALERQIARDLEMLEYPAKPWMKSIQRADGAHVYDVVIVGGGHCGIAAAFALMREKITNILVIDENAAGEEGPWNSYARMPDLRTRKNVTGLELGYPNLTFQRYCEARDGLEAYGNLKRISCDNWMAYLAWLRRVLALPVENATRMTLLEPDGPLFRLAVERAGRPGTLLARRVVLATGPLFLGGATVPPEISQSLPRAAWRHVYERFDAVELTGKRIIIVGAGASAFDNAATLLECGAASVDLLCRRPLIPRLSVIRWTDWAGFLNTYPDLDDAQRWQLMSEVQRNPSPPTLRSLQRVEGMRNFRPHFGSPVIAARMSGSDVVVETPKGVHAGDIVLLGTGFTWNVGGCKALAPIARHIALWSDRYTPPAGPNPEKYRNSPYTGRNYELIEKVPGEAPYLRHIYNLNQSATLSMGPTGRVSGLKYGLRRLVQGVTRSFVAEDFEQHLASVRQYNTSELDGHPWVEPPP